MSNRRILQGVLTDSRCADEATEVYATAAGITDSVELESVCKLVKAKKINGSWDRDHAIYPVSPTSLEASRFNLKDPTKFKLVAVGVPIWSTAGWQGNGSWYWKTNFIPSVEGIGNYYRWHYATNGGFTQLFGQDWGAATKGKHLWFRGAKPGPPIAADYAQGDIQTITTAINGIASYQRWFAFASVPEKHFWNGAMVQQNATAVNAELNYEIYIMAVNNTGTAQNESNASIKYWSFGDYVGSTSDGAAIEALHLDEYNNITEYNNTVRGFPR